MQRRPPGCRQKASTNCLRPKLAILLRTAWDVIREPMILLLISAAVIYLFLGELSDSLVLMGSIFFVVGIDLYQQRKTEHALEALRDLSSPRAMVIRDGQQRRVAGREVARGDIVIVSEGDRIPADGVLLSAVNLSVDESLLTGESVSVRKAASDRPIDGIGPPGGDDLPFVFSGTLVVQGQGFAEIRATGAKTELGKIGKALRSIEPEATKLQREVNRLAGVLAVLALSLCAVIAITYGLTRDSWVNGILAGITTAMALLPEEFPVVLTVFLALGAWRISQKQVLTRRGNAIEALGSATVLCVDKTGTLTQNRMAVRKLFADGKILDVKPEMDALPDAFHELLEYSILASKRNPLDPMEIAFQEFGSRSLSNTEHLHHDWTLKHEYPSVSGTLVDVARVESYRGTRVRDRCQGCSGGDRGTLSVIARWPRADSDTGFRDGVRRSARSWRREEQMGAVAASRWPTGAGVRVDRVGGPCGSHPP